MSLKKVILFLFVAALLGWGLYEAGRYVLIKKEGVLYIFSFLEHTPDLDDKRALQDFAVISPSCDKRHALWGAQFPLLFRYWPTLESQKIPVYLISNFRRYEDPRVSTIAVGKGLSWSDNLIKALDRIDKPYVVLLMDDSLLNKPVDEKRLIQVVNLMKANYGFYTEIMPDQKYLCEGMSHKSIPWLVYRRGGCKISLQTGVWDKEELKKFLKLGESAGVNEHSIYRPSYLVKGAPILSYFEAANGDKTENCASTKAVFVNKERSLGSASQQ